jgi:type IV secretion system protein VirB9
MRAVTIALSLALALALLCAAGEAPAEQLPLKGTVDSRIRIAPYNADQVYRLYAFVGYQIDLEFEPGETYVGMGSGDLEGLTVGAFENHVLLKPKAANVGTNLTVFTNRRHYHFQYSASIRHPDLARDEVIYAVRFTYPPMPKPSGPTSEERIEGDFANASERRPRNLDYWFCGNATLKPLAASDDGVHTRLTFGAKAELPAIFVRNDDGSESLLNFSIDEGDVIVHRLARRFILRRGKLTGCIINKGFAGSGERLQSGTVAPDVKRERKGSSP